MYTGIIKSFVLSTYDVKPRLKNHNEIITLGFVWGTLIITYAVNWRLLIKNQLIGLRMGHLFDVCWLKMN